MAYQPGQLSYAERLSRETAMTADETALLRKTYMLLALAVVGMIIGGKVGISTPAIMNLFSGWMGWVMAMVALNAAPMIALKFQHNPAIGTLGLFLDGFVSGIVIAPMIYMAGYMSGTGQNLVATAAWITGAIFISITSYVYISGNTWAPKRAMMTGIFVALIGAIILNLMLDLSVIGLLIAAGIGLFGVITIVAATTEVLNNRSYSSPVPAALGLFAGIFMVFQSVLYILMSFTGGDD